MAGIGEQVSEINGKNNITPETPKTTEQLTEQSYDSILESFQKVIDEMKNKKESGEKLTEEDKQKIEEARKLATKQISEITKSGLSSEKAKAELLLKVKSEVGKLLNSYTEEKTKEVVSNMSVTFFGEKSRSEVLNSLGDKSKKSLEKILTENNTQSLSQIIKNIEKISPRNDKGDIEYNFLNTGDLGSYLESIGYVVDGVLGGEEAIGVYLILKDYLDLQEKIPTISDQEKFKILVDFDRDGKLGSDLRVGATELQTLHTTLNGLNPKAIENLFKNLGIPDPENFLKNMGNNLFKSREDFRVGFESMTSSGLTIAELTSSPNRIKQKFEKKYSKERKEAGEITKEVSETIDNSKKLDQKLDELQIPAEDKIEVKEQLKLASVGVMTGAKSGIGAGVNIKELTNGIIDSLQIGFIGGNFGINFNKELFKGSFAGIDSSINLTNFFIPTLTLSRKIELLEVKIDGLKDKEIPTTADITIYGALSTSGGAIGANISRNDEGTKAGIEEMEKGIKKNLGHVRSDILIGNTFENSEFNKFIKEENKEESKGVYDQLKSSFDTIAKGSKQEKEMLDSMLNGYLTHYVNDLYKNNDGKFEISDIGGGLAFVAGFLPIPYLTLRGEYTRQNFKETNNTPESIKEQQTTTTENIDLKTVEYNGKEVYELPGTGWIFYNKDGLPVQAEEVGEKTYLSGKISSINIQRHFKSQSRIKEVYINGGDKEAKETPIVSNLDLDQKSTVGKKELKLTEQIAKNTESIRSEIFNLLDTNSLSSKDAPDLQKLQKAIFDYHKNGGDLNDLWQSFINTFAGFTGKYTNTISSQFPTNLTNQAKIIILQSIPATLMKKENLDIIDGKVEIGKTMKDYNDEKRNKFFDNIFSQELPTSSEAVKNAREEWMKSNGDSKSYNFKSIADGSMAFSATQGGGKNKYTGLMPYEGAYNIASTGGKDFIEMPKDLSLVDKISKDTLKNLQDTLHLGSTEEVKKCFTEAGFNGIKIDYKLAFCKMGECLNDAVVMKDMTITNTTNGQSIPISVSTSSSLIVAENDVMKLGVIVTGEAEEKPKPVEPTPTPTPTPTPPEQGSNPGVGDGTYTGGGGGTPGNQRGGR